MSKTYMTMDHPDAFKYLEVKEHPYEKFGGRFENWVVCPKCGGYGRYHLEINAYGEGRHFNAACAQCNDWGYVDPTKDVECIHEWTTEWVKMFDRKDTCVKCGQVRRYDTSG